MAKEHSENNLDRLYHLFHQTNPKKNLYYCTALCGGLRVEILDGVDDLLPGALFLAQDPRLSEHDQL